MSLVTEQGRRAKAEAEARAEALVEPMREFITEVEPVSVSKLIAHFSAEKENTVREAMWLLLDADAISIDEKRRIVLAGGTPEFSKEDWATIAVALRYANGGNFPLAAKAQRAWKLAD